MTEERTVSLVDADGVRGPTVRGRSLVLALLVSLAPCLPVSFSPEALAQDRRAPRPPANLYDPRLEEVRLASVAWENRTGPKRAVVDQVCLVPDVPTFLAVLATWDRSRWFPILIDDTEMALKFLRAFRPSRVVRYPKVAAPIPANRRWDEAVSAVGRSWRAPGLAPGDAPQGDAPLEGKKGTPGVVVASAASPSLGGAAALAAGRFQPLLRWEPDKNSGDSLSADDADRLTFDLEAKVIALIPDHDRLGDDCDFLTLAGDYPFRADNRGTGQAAGVGAFDDRIARTGADRRRWAFTGRLVGDPAASVYRAMCSLFLQPRSAALLNGYTQADPPWTDYDMRPAARRLRPELPAVDRSGPKAADIAGWHRMFDPVNRHGLVLINSSGGSAFVFSTAGPAGGVPDDVPPTEPAIVLTIHSNSAAEPYNPDSFAGRWLANGAFVYFGAMAEPYLQSFRAPSLLADLIVEGVPLGAAVRQGPGELFGFPWRLIYLGDPLYRVQPKATPAARVAATNPWPSYPEAPAPPATADDPTRFAWCLRAALARAGRSERPEADLTDTLLTIHRERLALGVRRHYEALLVDLLGRSGRLSELRARLGRIPAAEATPDVRRWLTTARVADLQRALAVGNFAVAGAVWDELIHSDANDDLKRTMTGRVGSSADSTTGRQLWQARLLATLRDVASTPAAANVREELKRLGPLTGGGEAARRPRR
jgi:hypothetical protein